MLRVFVEVFLKLVCSDYWRQIGSGAVPNQRDGEILLLTITLALSKGESDLSDFRFLREWIQSGSLIAKGVQKATKEAHYAPDIVQRFYRSFAFNIFVIVNIIISAAAVWVEEGFLDKGDEFYHQKTFWTTLEVWFLVVFFMEFVLKFWDLHCDYFKDVLNDFDFLLIFIGLFGLVFNMMQSGGGEQAADVAQQGRLVRATRLFRALRLVRILRLFRLLQFVRTKLKIDSEVHSGDISSHMQKVMMLRAFVHAHIKAQEAFLNIFCKDEQVETPETARVLLDSMTSVNLAIAKAVEVERSIDKRLLAQVRIVRECTDIAEQLEKFVYNAHTGGVISAKEAESIMHPLHAHLENFYRQLRRSQRGMTGRKSDDKSKRMLKKVGSIAGFCEAPNSDDSDGGGGLDGFAPMSLSMSARDLFLSHEVERRLDAKSRGWQILQKAFNSRNDTGPEARVWAKVMQGGTRLSRRKCDLRARKRKMSHLLRVSRQGERALDFGDSRSNSKSPCNFGDSRSNSKQPVRSTSMQSLQSLEPTPTAPSASPALLIQGKCSPKSSSRASLLMPPGASSQSRLMIATPSSSEVESLQDVDEASDHHFLQVESLSSEVEVAAESPHAPGMIR
jgi:hypothetical protein